MGKLGGFERQQMAEPQGAVGPATNPDISGSTPHTPALWEWSFGGAVKERGGSGV